MSSNRTLMVLPGDGVGPEVVNETLRVVEWLAKNKSITFKITIQSIDKTLDEKDLEQIHQNIINKISDKFQAKLRS